MSNELDDLELEYYNHQVHTHHGDQASPLQEENHPMHQSVNEYFHIDQDTGNNDNEAEFSQLKSVKSGQYLHTNSEIKVPYYEEDVVGFKDYYNHKLKDFIGLRAAGQYLLSFFPILKWLPHYNVQWFVNDIVAGITVGCVLVPQSMSYAKIASLNPQYGLYSSFVGAFIYCCFATSKDVCIGPVAVMSLQTAKTISNVLAQLPADTTVTGAQIATVLSLYCGIIAIGFGILRLGFLVEFISITAVSGFMTGSALNILWGQVPGLMGYKNEVNTRGKTYEVVINTLKHLPSTNINAVFGLIPLFLLFATKYFCTNLAPKLIKNNKRLNDRQKFIWNKVFFYANTLRNAVVIIVFTLISWGAWRHNKKDDIDRLGTVPKGFKDVGLMTIPDGISSLVAKELPASVIVLVLEHISISKAFGRVNGYRVVPDQELVAIGATNLIGTFFNAYPATGSFSRSALKAKCNVSTPLSGIFTGSCVILALYCLTQAFYFIPNATLCAVIIHAVADLMASYKTTWNFWLTNPLDLVGFLVTVLITVFDSIDHGIYFAMCWSAAVLFFKVAFPSGQFLGRVHIAEVHNPNVDFNSSVIVEENGSSSNNSFSDSSQGFSKESSKMNLNDSNSKFNKSNKLKKTNPKAGYMEYDGDFDDESVELSKNRLKFYTKWVPFNHKYTRELNGDVEVLPPPPGVIVYRPSESWTYLNCSKQYDSVFNYAVAHSKKGHIVTEKKWNEPGEFKTPFFVKYFQKNNKNNENSAMDNHYNDERPTLKIVCFDFSSVTQIDTTAVQSLVDLRSALNKYADRQVEFHFCGIISPWVRRALINSGFGTVNDEFANESLIVGHTSYHVVKSDASDLEYGSATGINLPFFHIDIPDFSEWDI
ncbi:hypothetical protein ACO0QE_002776 [Hanseniaspora vineae]